MFGLYDEEQVQHTGIELSEVFVLQHEEEVLSDGGSFLRMAYVQRPSLHGVAVYIIGIGNNRGEFRDEFNGLPHEIIARDVIGVLVEGVHLQHAARQNIHDVSAFEVNQMHHRAVVEWHVLVEQFTEGCQFLTVGQLP